MIDNLVRNIMYEVEFYYGDCNCDHHTICKFCQLKSSIKDILEVELNNKEEKTND